MSICNNKIFLFVSTSAFFLLTIPPVLSQQNPKNLKVNWKTDLNKHSVHLDEFLTLLEPDGIPPIDNPTFLNKEEGLKTYFEHEPVISVEIDGHTKAYPLSVLMFHEIVNDRLANKDILATYCPLCNAAIVFDRNLSHGGKTHLLDFGVSGMLRKSDMVMWDRQTESWWQQFTGEAIVGEFTGASLELIPSLLISVKEYFDTYPDGLILSTDNGKGIEYGINPYINYDNLKNERPMLFREKVNEKLPAMERVIDVSIKGVSIIYPLSTIRKMGVINDGIQGEKFVVLYSKETVSVLDSQIIKDSKKVGTTTVFSSDLNGRHLTFKKTKDGFRDNETLSLWSVTGKCVDGKLKGNALLAIPHGNHFAFAWFAFNPNSNVYQPK